MGYADTDAIAEYAARRPALPFVTFVVLPRLTKTALTVPYPGALKTAPDLADLIVVGTSNGI